MSPRPALRVSERMKTRSCRSVSKVGRCASGNVQLPTFIVFDVVSLFVNHPVVALAARSGTNAPQRGEAGAVKFEDCAAFAGCGVSRRLAEDRSPTPRSIWPTYPGVTPISSARSSCVQLRAASFLNARTRPPKISASLGSLRLDTPPRSVNSDHSSGHQNYSFRVSQTTRMQKHAA